MASTNRRDYFRHTFLPPERPRVELRRFGSSGGPADLSGPSINLSLNGIAVLFPQELTPAQRDQLWTLSFAVPGEGSRISFSGNVVHWHRQPDGCLFGFQFCGIDSPSQAESRRILWRYLLNVPRPDADSLAPNDELDEILSLGIQVDNPVA
jgi:hypothetical protein